MTLVFRIAVISLVISAAGMAQELASIKNGNDQWFAVDKVKHYTISVFGTVMSAKVAQRHFEMDKNQSIRIGVGLTISFGAMKEGIDKKGGRGTASIKDFVWDFAGCLTGAFLADLIL